MIHNLDWLPLNEILIRRIEGPYIAYQPGYPLMIADWKCGIGYFDVRTGITIDPKLLAPFNLPKELFNEADD